MLIFVTIYHLLVHDGKILKKKQRTKLYNCPIVQLLVYKKTSSLTPNEKIICITFAFLCNLLLTEALHVSDCMHQVFEENNHTDDVEVSKAHVSNIKSLGIRRLNTVL